MSELIAHNIEQTAWLLERDAETCAANERPGAGARMRIQPEAVNADHIARGQALLARVIENAAGERPAPAAVNVEPILERVIAAIGAVPGTNVELFERERLEPADFPVLCRTALALYRALRDLPGPEGAAVMRTLISQSP